MMVDGDETGGGGDSQPPVNTAAEIEMPIPRLSLVPNNEHISDSYDDLKLEFSSCVLRSLEKYLPPEMLTANREEKAIFMSHILRKYVSRGECSKRDFFEKLIVEVENFGKWVHETNFQIRRPYNTSKYGVVLDDFGLDIMLNKLMEEFIFPICRVFFPEVCGTMFDSHHGFFIENGEDRDAELGYHVDDSEITLNVCLRKQFEGGTIFFGGTRCEKHMDTNIKPEEIFYHSHIPGQAILHRGRHRHGARATTSGYRANMILWCRNSLFREMQTYEKGFSDWCGQCASEKKENESQSLAAKRKEMIRIENGAKAR